MMKKFLIMLLTFVFLASASKIANSSEGGCDGSEDGCIIISDDSPKPLPVIVPIFGGGGGGGGGDAGGGGDTGGGSDGTNLPGETKEECIARYDSLELQCHTMYGVTGVVTLGFCEYFVKRTKLPNLAFSCKLAAGAQTAQALSWCTSTAALRRSGCK